MDQLFEKILKNSKSRLIRVPTKIASLTFLFAGIVSIFSDIGLSTEITQYRMYIWLSIFILATIYTLYKEFINLFRKLSANKSQIQQLSTQINELKAQQASLLALMETYKRAAFTEILEHLERLVVLAAMKEKWNEVGAKVQRIHIQQLSDATDIDPEYAVWEKMDVIINIGEQVSVNKGMEFVILDPYVPSSYGTIVVKEVHSNASVCRVSSNQNGIFWETARESSSQNKPGIIEMPDNKIVPNLPEGMGNITPELALEIKSIIKRITSIL